MVLRIHTVSHRIHTVSTPYLHRIHTLFTPYSHHIHSSQVILELILSGFAPAAIVLREPDPIIAVGAVVAEEMFGKSLAVPFTVYTHTHTRSYQW